MAHTTIFAAGLGGLPDPETDRQFYSGVPLRRLAAWFVDAAVITVFALTTILVFGILTLGFGFALAPFLWLGIGILYRTVAFANRSSTWGMRLMGIELRRGDGSRLDPLTGFLHAVLYTTFFSMIVTQFVSVGLILTTRYRQSLPDMVLRTTAINCPAE